MPNFIFWSMASHGIGISGGDRIYIEFVKRWSKKCRVTVVTWAEGIAMMARNGLTPNADISFLPLAIPRSIGANFFICYLYRILLSLFKAASIKINYPALTYVYSSSEFWMDSLAAWVLKLRYPSITWVATWYQTAPSPLRGFSAGERSRSYRLNAFLLWATQLPIKPLIAKCADFVLVNNSLEKMVFPKLNDQNKAIVVLGAVNLEPINRWRSTHPTAPKKYAAVFQGRFHPQKGVGELIDIWGKVVSQKTTAKLAMIGDGPLMDVVKEKVRKLKLERNVELFGFVFDGQQKYKVFSQSQMVVHPAFFDSGGMASAEAMAFGIPAIGFDLPAYDSYYPQGMVKIARNDLDAFAKAIVELLDNPTKRKRIGNQAEQFINKSYSWDFRAAQILQQITERKDWERGRGAPRR